MRTLAATVLLLALSIGAAAQSRGGADRGGGFQPGRVVTGTIPFRTYGSPTGFGSVLFPGTGTPPPLIDPFSFSASFADRLGATISGFPGYTGRPSRGFRSPTVFPIPYPVYVGGLDNPYPYQQAPNVTIILPPQYAAQPAPPVTINQNFLPEAASPATSESGAEDPSSSNGGVHMYVVPGRAQAEAPQNDQILFLIALKDNSVYTAVAYWVEGETLHYITPQGKHNQVSLALVDRDISARLNEGRKVEFRLPPPKQ